MPQIPLVTEIREASDEGRPIVYSAPDSPPAQAYISIAERVWRGLQAADAGAQEAGGGAGGAAGGATNRGGVVGACCRQVPLQV